MGAFLIKLAEDKYLEFSTIVDAPTSYVMDEAEVIRRYPADRIERLLKTGTSLQASFKEAKRQLEFNRAGPMECCLTIEAMLERYASAEAYDNFILTPEKIQPYTIDVNGKAYWSPWKPDQVPAELPEGFPERQHEFLVSSTAG